MDVKPIVRYMVVCNEYAVEGSQGSRISALGLITNVKRDNPLIPATKVPQICILAALAGGRGNCRLHIEIRSDDTEEIVFQTPYREVQFGNEPLKVAGVTFRLLGCVFPHPGTYGIQLMSEESLLDEYSIVVR